MTQKEIIKGNRLIANFMGLKIKEPKGYTLNKDGSENCWMVFPKKYDNWDFPEMVRESEIDRYLKFHNNWTWLMSVVDKIETLSHVMQTSLKMDMSHSYSFNIIWYRKYTTQDRCYKSKIIAVYSVVVEFLNWYINYNNKE